MNMDIHKVKNKMTSLEIEDEMTSLIPDMKTRKLCLSLFRESILEANTYGAGKWGVYYGKGIDRLRLLVGSLIVLTITQEGAWIALDQELLDKSEELGWQNHKDWHWDTGRWAYYKQIPSRNGYYMPSDDHLQVWPIIRQLHFAYIDKAAKKYSQLRKDSQHRHMCQVLKYLRRTLNPNVPDPNYTNSVALSTQPTREVEQYQSTYQGLSKTERETIVQSRMGQGRFRKKLISYWESCAITGCQRTELLRASHIKPWRDSSNKERLDVYNGLLLIPNLDLAFDNGLISFTNDGNIIVSGDLTEKDKHALSIHSNMKITKLKKHHHKYLAYHRENIFKNVRNKN